MRVAGTWRRHEERGAVAVIVGMLLVVLIGFAALGVDIAQQVQSKQRLFDTMDAAAHAGAYELPGNGVGAAAVGDHHGPGHRFRRQPQLHVLLRGGVHRYRTLPGAHLAHTGYL